LPVGAAFVLTSQHRVRDRVQPVALVGGPVGGEPVGLVLGHDVGPGTEVAGPVLARADLRHALGEQVEREDVRDEVVRPVVPPVLGAGDAQQRPTPERCRPVVDRPGAVGVHPRPRRTRGIVLRAQVHHRHDVGRQVVGERLPRRSVRLLTEEQPVGVGLLGRDLSAGPQQLLVDGPAEHDVLGRVELRDVPEQLGRQPHVHLRRRQRVPNAGRAPLNH
jgi:hypothetical protein